MELWISKEKRSFNLCGLNEWIFYSYNYQLPKNSQVLLISIAYIGNVNTELSG
jgi:hypothetical protein